MAVARIGRSDYVPLFKTAMGKKAGDYKDMLAAIPFFRTFSQWTIEKLAGTIRLKTFARKQFVFKEQDDVDNLYIVKEGEFEQTKTFVIKADQEGKMRLESKVGATNTELAKSDTEASGHAIPGSEEPWPRSPLKNLRQTMGEKVVKLKSLGENELFGEDEIVTRMSKRQSNVHCTSMAGTVYVLSKEALNDAIDSTNLQAQLAKHVEQNMEAANDKLGTITKYTHVKLPRLQNMRERRKPPPMSEEERKEIKRKLNAFFDDKLSEKIKKAFPRYHVDLSYQYYDSRVLRGEEDAPTLHGLLTARRQAKDAPLPDAAEKSVLPPPPQLEELKKDTADGMSTAGNSARRPKERSRSIPKMRSDVIRQQAEREVELLLLKADQSAPKTNRRSQSTFVTSLNIQSTGPEPTATLPAIAKKRASQDQSQSGVAEALTDVAAAMVDQYKAMNNGSTQISKRDIPAVLNTILQSNKYLQNQIKSVKLMQKKYSQKILKSKHNMYRFKAAS